MTPKAKIVTSSSSVTAVESQMGGVPPQKALILGRSLQMAFAIENTKRLCPLNFFCNTLPS